MALWEDLSQFINIIDYIESNLMTCRVYVLAQFKPKAGKEAKLFEVLKALEPDAYREED